MSAHASSRGGRWVVVGLAIAVIGVSIAALVAFLPARTPTRLGGVAKPPAANGAHVARHTTAAPSPSPSPSAPPRPKFPAFASAGHITLYLPAPRPVLIGYHEATHDAALALRPRGHLKRNFNRYRFHPGPDRPGPAYLVMSSRGRGTPGSSAVDIVLRPNTLVTSPVDGVVASVLPYRLYCRYRDVRVAIRPDANPRLRVVLIHVARVRVHRGQRLFATLSVIGVPRVFPFTSETDYYVHGRDPHVHIEISDPAQTPPTACPARRGNGSG